ncbi:MAG: permease, partial [Anaerolineales bacterium]|nr:permease [Anaerolineales bacterium]
DGFLPRQLTFRGGRLVFSWGIAVLAGVASLLVILFQASVSALIPLYAIGVFLSFTLSQSGMVVRWHKVSRMQPGDEVEVHGSIMRFDPQWRWKQVMNALGAVMTFVVMIVFAVTKFRDGAWIVIVLTPALVWSFFRVYHHYKSVVAELSLAGETRVIGARPLRTIVLIDNLHAASIRAINFAMSLGQPWTAVHISIDPERTANLEQKWAQRMGDTPLLVLPSPYRSLTEPLIAYVQQLRQEAPDAYIHVVLGGLTTESFWQQGLHRNSTLVFRMAFRQLEGVAITNVPYQLHQGL